MHKDILSDRQLDLLPLMAKFKREYYLVGGTAIALHIGHRRSIDFDLFKLSSLNHKKNLDRITLGGFSYQVTRRVEEQMNLIVNGVKVTFFQYPFPIEAENKFENIFRLPMPGAGGKQSARQTSSGLFVVPSLTKWSDKLTIT